MPLSNILLDLAADLGIATDNTDERLLAVKRVNDAAKELYEADDLIGSLREQVFDMSTGVQQVSLPYYVGDIRGLRYYDSRLHIIAHDKMPRYSYGIGNEVWPLQWRMLSAKSPLSRFIDNQSRLNIAMPFPNDEDFSVVIVGKTPNSARAVEVIEFKAGVDLEKQTVNTFVDVEIISKSATTAFDLIVVDVDNNVVSFVPNNCKNAQFTILQIQDNETTNVSAVEVLYKLRYSPFIYDTDEFVVGHDQYDKAIYWKYVEHEYARNKDVTGAIAALNKCTSVCKQIADNAEAGLEKKINFAPCAYYQLSPFAIPMFSGKYYPRHVSH